MNRVVFVSLTILFLLSMSSITGLLQVAKAESGTITINADGSISPSTAPIYTADNVTYTLTGNITSAPDGILIERNNIVLNGAGYTVSGSGSYNGITLSNISNVIVTNMTITNFVIGIAITNFIPSSDNNTLSGNTVTANGGDGVFLESSNDTLSGNNVTANSSDGVFLESSFNWTLSSNNVANNGLCGIELDSSSDNTLSGNNVTNNRIGIVLVSSSNNTLSGNPIANNQYGIRLDSSDSNFIFHNNFVNNTNQAFTDGSPNIWDNGNSGNYWSDYLTKYPNATQVDSSGVWNTPYVIDTNNTDYYPLTVSIVVVPEFPMIQAAMFFMLLTLLAVIVFKKKGVKNAS
jgi:parallel beta-helix repeat protein